MSRKRTSLTQEISPSKKPCNNDTTAKLSSTTTSTSTSTGVPEYGYQPSHINGVAPPSFTKNALMVLRDLFPCEKFSGRLPSVMLRHQLNSFIRSESVITQELEDMKQQNQIHMFQLSPKEEDVVILLMDDYRSHVCLHAAHTGLSLPIANKFITTVINHTQEMCLSKKALHETYNFTEEEISELVKMNVLREKDRESWWFAIPGANLFRKAHSRGRKAVMTMMRKSKNNECYRRDLESRKLPKIAKLGMLYHIHDVIGAQLVTCIDTPAGQLMRINS